MPASSIFSAPHFFQRPAAAPSIISGLLRSWMSSALTALSLFASARLSKISVASNGFPGDGIEFGLPGLAAAAHLEMTSRP